MNAQSFATPFCVRCGLSVPVVQAPIGDAATPELAAAVSNAGGLGMLPMSWVSPKEAQRRIRATRELTDKPFGVNLALEWQQDERLAACLQEGVPVVSTFWGDPAGLTDAIHAAGALHLHTVGSADEARRCAAAGVDAVVAQGWEAGGHVWGQVATLPLIPAVVDAVPIPVIAAGGIADGRGLIAALALGAQAVWMGTRFLLAAEADVHDVYRERVLAAAETDATYTTLFDIGWPNAPHRALRNSTVAAWEAAGSPAPPHRPGEGEHVAQAPDGSPLPRYGDQSPMQATTGDVEALALYAGQGAGLIADVRPAGEIIADLMADARRIAARLGAQAGPPS